MVGAGHVVTLHWDDFMRPVNVLPPERPELGGDAIAKTSQQQTPALPDLDNLKWVAMAEYNAYSKEIGQAAELLRHCLTCLCHWH